jgi:ubiquinone/menaquinone biosynthesis C-methylase UbiE
MVDSRSMEDRKHSLQRQCISLKRFQCDGWILDIGGGGEGIIGKLFGEQVISIDPLYEELQEAAEGPLKIVMDGKDLKFLDNTFNTVTSFFVFMYIKKVDHEKVFQEVYRVMKPGGDLYIWDVFIPKYDGAGRDIYVMPIDIDVEGEQIETGYGTLWPEREQDIEYIQKLGIETAFKVVEKSVSGDTFYIRFKK